VSIFSLVLIVKETVTFSWRHDTQHNYIQYNDTQHIGLFATLSKIDT
jgi:hypothetical protein